MATFKDRNGDTWTLDVHIGTLRTVKQRLNIDLLNVMGTNLLQELAGDPENLVDVLYVLCSQQCDERGKSDMEFGRLLVGDAIEDAMNALVGALIDFFPKRQREMLRKIWTKVQAAESQQMTMLDRKLADTRMDQGINRLLAKSEQEIDRRLNALIGGDESTN